MRPVTIEAVLRRALLPAVVAAALIALAAGVVSATASRDGAAAEREARVRLAEAVGELPATEPPPAGADEPPIAEPAPETWPRVRWRRSRALGEPFDGRLRGGVRLPRAGRDFFTWDPVLRGSPNRHWRRWGTARLVRVLLRVAREHRAANPDAPRLTIGDLSRPRGGDFGARFGGLGHASHQSGLDADVYYPRRDRRELRAGRVGQVDLELAQDLVDRFVAAGAEYVFVGPATGLRGPRRIVQELVHHDDHLHVRLPSARALRARARR